jgi:long-chain acyl-CoA synthetase
VPPAITINQLLHNAREQWPERPYLKSRSGTSVQVLSYGKVISEAEEIAGGLVGSGVRPRDRVALLSENRPAWIISYHAILLAGATVVPLDSLMSAQEIVNILKLAQVRTLITTAKFHQMLVGVESGCLAGLDCYLLDDPVPEPHRPLPRKPGVPLPEMNPNDAASIIFTSGTTGMSKGVVLTHANLCGDVQAMVDAGVILGDDNFYLLLPLHHTYSSTVNMLGSLGTGASATFATSFKSRDILDDIRIAEVTMLVCVPQVFENIMTSIRRAVAENPVHLRVLFAVFFALSHAGALLGLHLGGLLFKSFRRKSGMNSIRLMISGGAALRVDVNRFFEALGFLLIQGYGLTETSPVITVNLPQSNRIGSVGTALPGVTLRICDPDEDEIGEICVQGPMVMEGYFENPEATSAVMQDGWLRTGDVGYLDRRENLHITGRLKNVIITGAGKNVHPEEIESMLNASPFVMESLVVGVTRRKAAGEELGAIIQPDQSAIGEAREHGHEVDVAAEIQKVVDAYNHSVPAYRRIRRWQIWEQDFEKTSTRKIKRYLYKNFFPPVE